MYIPWGCIKFRGWKAHSGQELARAQSELVVFGGLFIPMSPPDEHMCHWLWIPWQMCYPCLSGFWHSAHTRFSRAQVVGCCGHPLTSGFSSALRSSGERTAADNVMSCSSLLLPREGKFGTFQVPRIQTHLNVCLTLISAWAWSTLLSLTTQQQRAWV